MSAVWVGVTDGGNRVEVASTVKGLSDLMGASYWTMKEKAAGKDGFVVIVDGLKMWNVKRVEVRKVFGRGGKRVSGVVK